MYIRYRFFSRVFHFLMFPLFPAVSLVRTSISYAYTSRESQAAPSQTRQRAARTLTVPASLRGRVPSRRVLVDILVLQNLTCGARVPQITDCRAPNHGGVSLRLRMQGCPGARSARCTRSARVPRSAFHFIAHDTLLTATRTSRRQAAVLPSPWCACGRLRS